MISLRSLLPLVLVSATFAVRAQAQEAGDTAYPETAKGDVVDEHHGVQVPDPYRWLEDPDSEDTQAWVRAQNELTFAYLRDLPGRKEIEARLTELWNYERFNLPIRRGERLFYRRNDGLQAQSVLYVTDDSSEAGRVLIDPAEFSEDGTMALSEVVPSPDGKLLAYSISDGGSDWRTWHFLAVDSGELLPDVLTRNKFGGLDWLAGGEEVVYTRFERPSEDELVDLNLPAEICLHRLGTDEKEDIVLRARPEAGFFQWGGVDEDRQRVVANISRQSDRHSENFVLSRDAEGNWSEQALTIGYEAQEYAIGNQGDTFFVQSNRGAPNWQIYSVTVGSSDPESWSVTVPEAEQSIESASVVGGKLVLTYLQDATSRVKLLSLEGEQQGQLELPGVGTVSGLGGSNDDPRTFYSFSTFTQPPVIYAYDVATGENTLFRAPEVPFDPEKLVTEQVFVESKDGTQVPMFLTYAKGINRDGSNPTLLYGYGGFNISLTPRFSPVNMAWLEMGGIYAVANLRGGGEYGEDWHKSGTKLQKQNVFDDFIACAEWLIAEDYTAAKWLGIQGGSNGGLLVGACMTQRPELFGAALPAVGVMDMLRYHLFTIGWAWAGDYGTVDDADEFRALLAYSPLHNLKKGTSYPATLVTTAERDDRVVPAHSFKFAAALQAAHRGTAPVMIRIETRAGHGAGKPTQMRIEEAADQLTFLLANLGREGAGKR